MLRFTMQQVAKEEQMKQCLMSLSVALIQLSQHYDGTCGILFYHHLYHY